MELLEQQQPAPWLQGNSATSTPRPLAPDTLADLPTGQPIPGFRALVSGLILPLHTDLKGNIVLVFWSACINCHVPYHTLPGLASAVYSYGLKVMECTLSFPLSGSEQCQKSFEATPDYLSSSPDNEFKTWNVYNNTGLICFSSNGILRYDTLGKVLTTKLNRLSASY